MCRSPQSESSWGPRFRECWLPPGEADSVKRVNRGRPHVGGGEAEGNRNQHIARLSDPLALDSIFLPTSTSSSPQFPQSQFTTNPFCRYWPQLVLIQLLSMELIPIANHAQVQRLTTALKNICRDYPAGSTVLRELLQNADDAGATEVVRTSQCSFPKSPSLTSSRSDSCSMRGLTQLTN